MPKIVDIKDKMGKPTLQEVIKRLDGMFDNMVYRGEDRINISLATVSFCLAQLSLEFQDKEVRKLVDEVLSQYIDKTADKQINVNYCHNVMTVKNMIRMGF